MSLDPRTKWRRLRFFVASARVRDLLLRAKHLFVAAAPRGPRNAERSWARPVEQAGRVIQHTQEMPDARGEEGEPDSRGEARTGLATAAGLRLFEGAKVL